MNPLLALICASCLLGLKINADLGLSLPSPKSRVSGDTLQVGIEPQYLYSQGQVLNFGPLLSFRGGLEDAHLYPNQAGTALVKREAEYRQGGIGFMAEYRFKGGQRAIYGKGVHYRGSSNLFYQYQDHSERYEEAQASQVPLEGFRFEGGFALPLGEFKAVLELGLAFDQRSYHPELVHFSQRSERPKDLGLALVPHSSQLEPELSQTFQTQHFQLSLGLRTTLSPRR